MHSQERRYDRFGRIAASNPPSYEGLEGKYPRSIFTGAPQMIANLNNSFGSPVDYLLAEYLSAEADRPIKHEYRDGFIHARTGTTDAHVTISGTVLGLLRVYWQGADRRIFMSDIKTMQKGSGCYIRFGLERPFIRIAWMFRNVQMAIVDLYGAVLEEIPTTHD